MGKGMAWDEEKPSRFAETRGPWFSARHPPAKVLPSSPGRTARSELCRPQCRTGIVLPKHQPHKRKDNLVRCCDPSAYSTDRPGTEHSVSRDQIRNGEEVTPATCYFLGILEEERILCGV